MRTYLKPWTGVGALLGFASSPILHPAAGGARKVDIRYLLAAELKSLPPWHRYIQRAIVLCTHSRYIYVV